VHRDVLRLVHRRQVRSLARVHQVSCEFGLPIDHHVLAARQAVHVDAVALAAEKQLEAAVHQAFGVHPSSNAGFVHQVDAHLFEDASADSAEHVVGGLAFENDVVDAGLVEQLSEQQARRACTDDGNLCSHDLSCRRCGCADAHQGSVPLCHARGWKVAAPRPQWAQNG
jgi:hypothetical protein